MRFWDASAVVPLLVDQTGTLEATNEYEGDPDLVVWWAARVEIRSALARLEREGALHEPGRLAAEARAKALEHAWKEIEPNDAIRQSAMRLLRLHPLGAADALVLAAATCAAEGDPTTIEFVTLDDRLAQAAGRQGFAVVRPAPGTGAASAPGDESTRGDDRASGDAPHGHGSAAGSGEQETSS